jgi:hypothetical protein
MSRRRSEDMERDLDALRKYLKKAPRTIGEVEKRFGIRGRTVYSWFDALGRRGCAVLRVGYKRPGRYLAT